MGKQSARMYSQGKDHKDIYFQGHYHDRMYVGSQLVWEKLRDEKLKFTPLDYAFLGICYGNGIFLGFDVNGNVYTSKDGSDYNLAGTAPKRFNNCIFFNGYFYMLHSERNIWSVYRTSDGTKWEELTGVFTDIVGAYSGNQYCYINYGIDKESNILIASVTPYGNIDIQKKEVVKPIWPMGLYSVYASNDFVNFYSQNILTRINSYGTTYCRIGCYQTSNGLTKINGYYFFSGVKVIKNIADLDNTNIVSEGGTIKTADFINCEVYSRVAQAYFKDFMLVTEDGKLYKTTDLFELQDITSERMYSDPRVYLYCENDNYYAVVVQDDTYEYAIFVYKKSDDSIFEIIDKIDGLGISSFLTKLDMSDKVLSAFVETGDSRKYIVTLALEE